MNEKSLLHKAPVSVTIITLNEEANIERCLQSVIWADEIVVVDSGSIDKTISICESYHCKIYSTEWEGFGKAKQKAVDYANNDWVLSIDADEELSLALQEEIVRIVNKEADNAGYRIRRWSYYLGRKISHGGWDRDWPLRLFSKKCGHFNEKLVHESVDVSGSIARIEYPMWHYTYPTISSHLLKMQRYAELFVAQNYQKKTSSPIRAVMRGFFKFVKMYILQVGFLDGKEGFLLSYHSAWGVYLKHILLWEKKR